MKQHFIYKMLFATTVVTFAAIVAATVIKHKSPHSLDEWFDSTNTLAKVEAFRTMGAKSFPFIIEKLGGSISDRERACLIIQRAFDGSQIENSEIKSRLVSMLKSGQDAEELYAYNVIQRLGIKVPDAAIATAAKTCPSIRASKKEAARRPKLMRLHNMNANSLDCAFVAQLCNDPDPQVQMETLNFLVRCERAKTNGSPCADEIVPALALLMTNTTDSSILGMALAYMSDTPILMRENLMTVCNFLEKTTNSSLQMDCLALLATLSRYGHLPSEAQHSVELLHSRPDLDPNIRREANALLNDRQLWTLGRDNHNWK